jgi:hypothetical protein
MRDLTVLDLREAINIALAILASVQFVLYARAGWCYLTWWQMKPFLGWSLICLGEAVRSSFVWDILHFNREQGTYASEILPLLGALGCITAGCLLCINAFTPDRWNRHSLWLPSLGAVVLAIAVNWLLV